MLSIPSIPTLEALHPAIAHFPIALLIIAPFFVLLAWLLAAERRILLAVALGLLVVATVGVYLSAFTGDEARDAAPKTAEISTAIEHHEALGSAVRAISTAMTLFVAGLFFSEGRVRSSIKSTTFAVLVVVFLALSLASAVLVVDAAHSGGVLVHNLGVHAGIR